MSLKDYAHHNEDAEYFWYMEEGRHPEEPPEPDDYNERYFEHEDEEEEPETCYLCEEPITEGQTSADFLTEFRGHPWYETIHEECRP